MKKNLILVFSCLLALVSCSKEKTNAPSLKNAAPESAPIVRQVDTNNEKVRKFMDQWLEAQNKGDFSAYEKLYAERFTGIRRSGNKTIPLNREGWMKDRKRMFAHPMKVEIDQLSSSPMGESLLAKFEQTWTSATYQDKGFKNIVLIPTSQGGFQIAREEMLSSEKEDLGDGLSFLYVIPEGVVIDVTPDLGWATGPAQFVSYEDVRRNVDFEKLPTHVQQMRGRTFNFYDASGKSCQGTIKDFFLTRQAIHHFGSIQNWEGGYEEEGKKRVPVPKQTVADEIWGKSEKKEVVESDQGFWLIAKNDSCKGSLWARDASEKAPSIIPFQKADAQWSKLALEQLPKLAFYKQLQKDFESYGPDHKGLWTRQKDSEVKVFSAQSPLLKNPWIAVSARQGSGCGDFGGEIFAVWEVSGVPANPQFKLLNKPDESFYLEPLTLIDIEGDGKFEILFEIPNPGFLYMENGLFQHDYQLITPNYDCPC